MKSTTKYKTQWSAYLYLLPIAVLIFGFMLYPFCKGVYLSFFKTKYGFGDIAFSGLRNYLAALQLESFLPALKNSLVWVAVNFVLNSVVPIAIGILLNRRFRGKQIVIGSLMIPWITPVIAYAMMNRWLLEANIGPYNQFFKALGITKTGIDFLGSTSLALPTLVVMNFCQFMPIGVLLISSALSTIPNELYDA